MQLTDEDSCGLKKSRRRKRGSCRRRGPHYAGSLSVPLRALTGGH